MDAQKLFERAERKRLSDIMLMDTSQQSRSGEEPGPQEQPLKEAEGPLKEKAVPPEQPAGEKAQDDETDESLVQDEEPGTFDRVYEHGRQMGF
jgi:hypothetical protein